MARVAQLVRAPSLYLGGSWFESRHAHKMKKGKVFFIIGFSIIFAVLAGAFFIDRKIDDGKNEPLPRNDGQNAAVTSSLDFNPYSLSWTLATSSAGWEPRDSAASFVFQNKIWIMGGINGNAKVNSNHTVLYWEAPHFNDIWTTEDGENWKTEARKSFWLPKRSMSVVEFKGKLWMFGGWSPIEGYTRDIWMSEDGINWRKIFANAAWPAREGQEVRVFKDKLFMMGGVNYDARKEKNDVWYSENGIDWRQATATIPWAPRWDHATAVFNDKIFLTGGMNLSGKTFKDVWSSADGINWELIAENPAWSSRQGHALIPYRGYLWLVGRLNDSENGGENDVWFSRNGLNWEKTINNPPWTGREDFSYAVLNDKIYVFAGMDQNWQWRDDVWTTEFPQ